MKAFAFTNGQRFGRLTIRGVDFANSCRSGGRRWLCLCDCGSETSVAAAGLRSGKTQSCGCLHRETSATNGHRNVTHGDYDTPTYRSWASLRNRCLNPRNVAYRNYGGRGITVCERWKSYQSFLIDMGERPSGTSIDRVDNNGNYEPSNCRWATDSQQRANTRRSLPSEACV